MTLKAYRCIGPTLEREYCEDCGPCLLRAHPEFTFPKNGGPVSQDTGTAPVRPINSYATVAAAAAGFVGFTDAAPRAAGNLPDGTARDPARLDRIRVYKKGKTQITFAAPTTVSLDPANPTQFTWDVDANGLPDWTRGVVAVGGPLTACEWCDDCPTFAEDPCATSVAATDAATAFAEVTRDVTKVWVEWDTNV